MKKTLKWFFIAIAGLCVVIMAALLLIPMFVDIQDYKPRLETMVSEETGRDFRIGGDLKLSLFPWAGIEFADLTLGNPDGYQEKNFVSISSFDVQVKLMPLLSRNVEIKRFVIEGPTFVFEKSAAGKGNWEGLGDRPGENGKNGTGTGRETESAAAPDGEGNFGGLPIKSLQVGQCAINKGTVVWIDHGTGARKTLSDLNLDLQNVSLDKPIGLSLSGLLDEKAFSIEGSLGPVGSDPGKDPIALDLVFKAFDHLDLAVKGKVSDPATAPRFDMTFQLSSFSPRKLLKTLSEPFPVDTSDPGALDRLAAKGSINGSTEKISVTDGELNLDDSRVSFSIDAGEFEKPVLSFNIEVGSINLDRYMPPAEEGKDSGPPAKNGTRTDTETDYAPLRKPVINGTLLIGKLTAAGAEISDLSLKLTAENGLYEIDPINLAAYDGTLKARAVLDVRKDRPATSVELAAQDIKVNPVLRDALDKDFLDGVVKTEMSATFTGENAAAIKKSLNGNGQLTFQDGAIVGIDLADMVRNVTGAFGLADKPAEKPRTDFSELNAPFTIRNGVVNTTGTTLNSPLLRLLATGDANLVTEVLDMRLEPKVVASLKGQGDVKERSGILVPVLVSGTFSEPKFRPDMKGILSRQGLEVPKTDDIKRLIPGTGEAGKESLKDSAKELLKSLPFGKN